MIWPPPANFLKQGSTRQMSKRQIRLQITICIFFLAVLSCVITGWAKTNTPISLLQKLAEQGNAEKQYELAFLYLKGTIIPKDLEKAVYWLQKSSEQGFANAQYSLALRYLRGEGIAKNNEEAIKWLKAAAEQGSSEAQFSLALRYKLGQGVKQNESKQIHWLKKAIHNGHKEALYNLALLLARRGTVEAQLHVANLYYKGFGTEQDHKKAAYWYEKAARQGNAVAQYTYAVLLNNGEKDLSRDYKKSAYWYEKSAEQGYAPAQLNLGAMYALGTGVKKDIAKAYAWTYLAARQQSKTAQKNCTAAAQEMTAQQLATAKKMAAELQNRITSASSSSPKEDNIKTLNKTSKTSKVSNENKENTANEETETTRIKLSTGETGKR